MKVNYSCQRKAGVTNYRSIFDWGYNMQIVHRGNGDIAMTEGELVRFFGVTWRKLNHKLQTIIKSSNLHLDERGAGQEPVFINGQPKGYALLYPLSIIISLSFLLNNTEAYLFRKYICQKLQKPAFIITPIFLIGNMEN